MVEQTEPARPGLFPARPGRSVPRFRADPAAAQAERQRLLLIVVVALFIPGTLQAGIVLSPYRVVLIALFPLLLWRWVTGAAGRCTTDFLMLLGVLWTMLALVVHQGIDYLPRCAIIGGEMYGGYLVGRMLIRNHEDFKQYFRYFTFMFAILLPFIVLEAATGFNLIRKVFDVFLSIPPRQHNLGQRLGLHRAQGPFEHPILLGLVASMGVANAFYIWRNTSLVQGLARYGFFVFTAFMSVSSGPMLAVLCQSCLIAWDRTLAFMKVRWVALVYLGLFSFLLLRIASQFNLLDFVIDNLMFNSNTAGGRLVILQYGSREVIQNPVFGIGMTDWERPWWRAGKGSFDNFWLLIAMRYGLPAFLLIAAAWLSSFARIALRPALSPLEADYRRGYLITMTGLTIILGTVYIWNATSVFVWIYLGAGVWFYTQPPAEDPHEAATRARRAAQARGFVGAATAAVSGGGTGWETSERPGRAMQGVTGR
jgi:hypothetical protein